MVSVQPPYPSFALVLSGDLPDDTSRLPTYRLTHLNRFHPYARTRMPTWERLAMDDDHRCEEPPPTLRRSSFALTTDVLENAEIEMEVDETSVRLFVQQQAHSRRFRIVVDYFATLLAAVRRKAVRGQTVEVQPVLPKRNKRKLDLLN